MTHDDKTTIVMPNLTLVEIPDATNATGHRVVLVPQVPMTDDTNDQLRAGDIVSMDVRIVPKWWQFWKKPYIERQLFVAGPGVKSNKPIEWKFNDDKT